MAVEERTPRGDCVVAAAGEPRVLEHFANRHVGGVKLLEQLEPAKVGFAVTTVAASRAGDRLYEADALVVAKRVNGDTRARGRFSDGEAGLRRPWHADQDTRFCLTSGDRRQRGSQLRSVSAALRGDRACFGIRPSTRDIRAAARWPGRAARSARWTARAP